MGATFGKTPMPRSGPASLLLCGYYGEHNLGDDALLQVLLQGLPGSAPLMITAHDQAEVQGMAPLACIVNRRSLRASLIAVLQADVLILGGGSLLQDSTSFRSLIYYLLLIALARLRRRRVVLWGQGLGPLRRSMSRWLVRCALPFCSAASWRDQASLRLAQAWAPNLPMCMAADPVWQMPSQPWIGGGHIVLSWRPTDLLDGPRWQRLLHALDSVAASLDVSVCWMAFHQHQDGPLLDALVAQKLVPAKLLARSTTVIPRSLDHVFELVSTARLVLPMRLHALILARLVGCPMAALSYDPKVDAAAEMAQVPCTRLNDLPSTDHLAAQWMAEADQEADRAVIQRIQSDASAHGELLRRWI